MKGLLFNQKVKHIPQPRSGLRGHTHTHTLHSHTLSLRLYPSTNRHTPSKLVPEGRDETNKGVSNKQKLGVMLELECHQVAGKRTIMAPKPGKRHTDT